MARRKSPAEVGPLGVWAYDTRDALDLSVEAAVAALPTQYHPATLRKVEGGSARPGTRMWRELANLYTKVAAAKGIAIDPQPRLTPEPLETTESGDALIRALEAQTAAISELVAEVRLSRGEETVSREALMKALGFVLAQRGTPAEDGHDTPVGVGR